MSSGFTCGACGNTWSYAIPIPQHPTCPRCGRRGIADGPILARDRAALHQEIRTKLKAARDAGIQPCRFCAVPANPEDAFCFGCAAIICKRCQLVVTMPDLEHGQDAHRPFPESEIMVCWKCGTRVARREEDQDRCPECAKGEFGSGFGAEEGGATA